MNNIFRVGLLLVTVSVVPVIQMTREVLFWERGGRRYDERVITALPIRFGGHTLAIADSLPHSDYSEDAHRGTAQILLDGKPLGEPQRAMIRPGRRDIGRYHGWIAASIFRDLRSGHETLWAGRRVESPGLQDQTFEIVRIDKSGAVSSSRVQYEQRADSYPQFRTIQSLSDSLPTVYAFSMANGWPSLLVPILYPWAIFVLGLILLRAGWRESQRKPGTIVPTV